MKVDCNRDSMTTTTVVSTTEPIQMPKTNSPTIQMLPKFSNVTSKKHVVKLFFHIISICYFLISLQSFNSKSKVRL